MTHLVVGKTYHVDLHAYELEGYFEGILESFGTPTTLDNFGNVVDYTQKDATFSNGVHLAMWGYKSSEEFDGYGWVVQEIPT